MAVVRELSQFVYDTDINDIPEDVLEFGKFLLSKIVASMLSGSKTVSGQKFLSYIKEKPRQADGAGIVGSQGMRVSLEDAVFTNGVFAHAAELEDDQFPSSTSDITVIPVVFPLADKFGLTGRDVVEATVLGLEVLNRVGMYPLASRGFVELPFYGVIGACITASKALKLSAPQISSALGIAMGRASGLISNFGTDAHYIESAVACRDGMLAALLAKRGMSGNPDIEGWLANLLGKGAVDTQRIIEGLGKTWKIKNIWIKKYPCCFIIHRPIDILFRLMEQHGFSYDDIAQAVIHDGPVSIVCDRPDPAHTDEARFSFQHAVAAAMLYGDVVGDHFMQDKMEDAKFKEARSKIKLVIHDDFPAEFLSGTARLDIILKNGDEFSGEIDKAIGAPDSPLNSGQVQGLFDKITRNILSPSDIKWVWEQIINLDNITDLKPLMEKVNNS